VGRRLGQHFLRSSAAIKKIVAAGEISPDDTVLEIGPGRGILTEELLKYAGKVIAVEIDKDLYENLRVKFEKEIELSKLDLENSDISLFDLSKLEPGPYKLVANIPYYLTGAILKKFLTGEPQPERMVLLLQKEVVERVLGRKNPSTPLRVKESILSISVKAYGQPATAGKVPARYFSPAPRVDSAILVISDISRRFFIKNELNEAKFWQVVKKGFAHKRKKLGGNLKNAVPGTTLAQFADKRAEDLTLKDWISLSRP